MLSTYDSGDHFGELLIILGEHLSDHKCAALAAEKSHLDGIKTHSGEWCTGHLL